MGRKVEYYDGYSITSDVLDRVNTIACSRFDDEIFRSLYDRIETVEVLSSWYDARVEDVHVILGEDWYFTYVVNGDVVTLTDWVDTPTSNNKISQSIEMFKAIRGVLLTYEDCVFEADLKHDTSYPFYERLRDDGFVETVSEFIDVIEIVPPEVYRFANNIRSKYGEYENYFADKERVKVKEMERYFCHQLQFFVTDKFVDKFFKKERE